MLLSEDRLLESITLVGTLVTFYSLVDRLSLVEDWSFNCEGGTMKQIDPPFTRASERGAVEEEFYRHLAEHVGSEAEFIASYKQLAEAEDTPEAARYLIRIILEDEERHHRVFRDLTAAV